MYLLSICLLLVCAIHGIVASKISEGPNANVELGPHGQNAVGIITPVDKYADFKLTYGSDLGITRERIGEDHCITLCVFEYKTAGRCSSVNYDRQNSTCYIQDKHYDDDWSVDIEEATGYIWYDLGFGPPETPTVWADPVRYDPSYGDCEVMVRFTAGLDGGFEQTFTIEYKTPAESTFDEWDYELPYNKTGETLELVWGLLPSTQYIIRLTAVTDRPVGYNTNYDEVYVTTHPVSSGRK